MDEAQAQSPHCDQRILHLSEECWICASYPLLQEERARAGISNTGHSNREHPCPADQARSTEAMYRWPGNRPEND